MNNLKISSFNTKLEFQNKYTILKNEDNEKYHVIDTANHCENVLLETPFGTLDWYTQERVYSQFNFDSLSNEFSLEDFILQLQELSPIDAFGEIATAGLNDTEIAICVKTISESNFKFKK